MASARTSSYKSWLGFSNLTPSSVLRGCMMDLHWFVNHSTWRLAVRDLARFCLYLWRFVRAPAPQRGVGAPLLFVVDTPGVGGVLTLLPLLDAMPASTRVTLAVTDFIQRDSALARALAGRDNVTVVNIDRASAPLRLDSALCRSTFALARRFPSLLATVPLFLLRQHVYCAVARALFAARPTAVLVVFNERMLPSASFCESARLAGVPTLALQHGNFVDNYLPVRVDRYFTWGRFHSDWLKSRASCTTETTGAPRMDAQLQPARTRFEWPRDRAAHLVFFSQVGAASVSPEMIAATRREIMSLVGRPDLRVSIKLHPQDQAANWTRGDRRAHSVAFLPGQSTVSDALAEADIVCSFYSTVLAEALLWDIPVVQLNPFPDAVDGFPDHDGIATVTSGTELLRWIDRLASGEVPLRSLIEHQRRLRDGYFSHLGHACTRFWQSLPDAVSPIPYRGATLPIPNP